MYHHLRASDLSTKCKAQTRRKGKRLESLAGRGRREGRDFFTSPTVEQLPSGTRTRATRASSAKAVGKLERQPTEEIVHIDNPRDPQRI